jgi:hypothetical protein
MLGTGTGDAGAAAAAAAAAAAIEDEEEGSRYDGLAACHAGAVRLPGRTFTLVGAVDGVCDVDDDVGSEGETDAGPACMKAPALKEAIMRQAFFNDSSLIICILRFVKSDSLSGHILRAFSYI